MPVQTLLSLMILEPETNDTRLIVTGTDHDNVVRYWTGPARSIELDIDGQRYSSDRTSPFFTPTLDSLTTDTLRHLQFDGGLGVDTLVVDDPLLAHSLVIQGDEVVAVDGAVEARGTVAIAADTITVDGTIAARSISLRSVDSTEVFGSLTALDGAVGGYIEVLGDRVSLLGATVDASGLNGGGTILIGGDMQGQGPTPAADFTLVDASSVLSADALAQGNGGQVIIWANDTAYAGGSISAQGGIISGDGGFVETSGLKHFQIATTPDVSAPAGLGGDWLIDPNNIAIVAGAGNTNINAANPFSSTNDGAQLGVDLVTGAVTGGASVSIATGTSGNSEVGDITLNTPLDFEGTGTNNLTLNAANDILINGQITDSVAGGDSLNVTLNADSDGSGTGGVAIAQSISTGNVGNFTITASGPIQQTAGALAISGAATFITAGTSDITLSQPTNDFMAEVSSLGNNITLVDANGIALGASSITGNLDVTATDISIRGSIFVQENITFTSDTIALNNTLSGSGLLTIAPQTASNTIGIGNSATGTLNLDATELGNLVDGLISITIGDTANGTGRVDVNTSTFNDPVTIVGGDISLAGLNAGTNAVTLTARTGAIADDGTGTDITGNATFDGAVQPGGSGIGQLVVDGAIAFAAGSTLTLQLNGDGTAGTDYDQLQVMGNVDLSNVALTLDLGYTPTDGESLILVDNDGTDAITGTFSSFADDTVVTVGGFTAVVDYQGGDGNDVELRFNTSIPTPTTPDLRSATDTGRSTIDNLTNSNMPLFAGVADPNSTVTLFSNVDGTIGTTTADESGRWSITASNLSAGNHTITATATDGLNISSASPALAITIDQEEPTVVTLTPNVTPITDSTVGSGTFSLTIDFSEAMDTRINPAIAFPTINEDPSSILNFASGSWSDNDTYLATYDVLDSPITLSGIDIQITGAQDEAGNVQATSDQSDVFSISIAPVNDPSEPDTSTSNDSDSADSDPTDVLPGQLGMPLGAINFDDNKPGITLQGTQQKDRLFGTPQSDIIRGGRGNDRLFGGRKSPGFGKDQLFGQAGNDVLKGGQGNDFLDGGNGNDRVVGGKNHDQLVGGRGKDILLGNKGNDILIGGAGNDRIKGGSGKDMIVYTSLNDGRDTLQQFEVRKDIIDLRQIFTDAAFAGDNDFQRFSDYVELVDVKGSTEIQVDADGRGNGTTMVTLAIAQGVIGLTSENVVIS